MTVLARIAQLAVVLSAVACSDGEDRSAPTSTPGPNRACTLPGTYGSAACDQCLYARCCAELAACNADGECAGTLACALDCEGTPATSGCVFACFNGEEAPSAMVAVDDCSFDECESVCFSPVE